MKEEDRTHALACLKYLEQLALAFVSSDSSKGDSIDVSNNAEDIRRVLNGISLYNTFNITQSPVKHE